jgi:VIT1/CCC1 family predicted Fe2+/Mn2+ transporter
MRSGWLRAAVLGANDGVVSVSSLVVGVAAADPSPSAVLIAGVAGLAAGALSMAAGEYVSVSSQSDIEKGRHRPRDPGAQGHARTRNSPNWPPSTGSAA